MTHHPQAASTRRDRARRPGTVEIWVSAARPRTLTAAAIPVVVGSALAVADGYFRPGAALAAMLGALLIQVGTNLFNDYADFRRGADTADRIGPPRATERGWLQPAQVVGAATLCFTLAATTGIYLVWVAGWPILVVGVASIASGVAYTGGPYPLGYHGLGDLFVFLFFGLAAVMGTYFVHASALSLGAFAAASAVGSLATAILVVNNLRDRRTDAAAGKRTLVVRHGPRFARLEYVALVVAAYVIPVAAVGAGCGNGWLLPLLSAPLAWHSVRRLYRADGLALNPLLGATAQLGVVHGLCLSLGALL